MENMESMGSMEFTHFDQSGNATMVDVSEKEVTQRLAVAEGRIRMTAECFEKVKSGRIGKGDVLAVARIAGIMAAKKTADMIPLCHTVNVTKVSMDFEMSEEKRSIRARCSARCTGRTGVEMEALAGVSVALLTVYDMCKSVDRAMEITGIRLLRKAGGKTGVFERSDVDPDAADAAEAEEWRPTLLNE